MPGAPSSDIRGKFIKFIEPQGVNGHRRSEPGAPSSVAPQEKARQRSGTVPCGDCKRVVWDQYSRKIRFIEKSGIQDEGVFMWLNIVLNDIRIAYP